MKTSQEGIDLIKKYEGLHLKSYKCPSGVWTVGYGHTAHVHEGMKISELQAEGFLKSDLQRYENYVNDNVTFPMTQSQFDALVSFTFNCGVGNLRTLIKDRTAEKIASAILLYNKSGGKVLEGLNRRRKEERELFVRDMRKGAEISHIEKQTGILEYSWELDGNEYVSKNFQVYEFRCQDGSDKILIDVDFVREKLQAIRDYFNKPVRINSAYRHAVYNDRVGGAKGSYHVKGQAFDIAIHCVDSLEIAKFAESINVPGIIKYKNFVHVDSREKRYWAYEQSGRLISVSTFEENYEKPVLKIGSKGKDVIYLQTFLTEQGMYHGKIDGDFGPLTKQAVIEWQGYEGITKDGIVGKATWATIG